MIMFLYSLYVIIVMSIVLWYIFKDQIMIKDIDWFPIIATVVCIALFGFVAWHGNTEYNQCIQNGNTPDACFELKK